MAAGKEKKADTQNKEKRTRRSAEQPFEEQFWTNPREAVSSKIFVPLVESVRSRRSARSGKDEPSTEHNSQTEA